MQLGRMLCKGLIMYACTSKEEKAMERIYRESRKETFATFKQKVA